MKNAGSLIVVLVLLVLAYKYGGQILAMFSRSPAGAPNIASFANSPYQVSGAPTYGYAAGTNPLSNTHELFDGFGVPPSQNVDQIPLVYGTGGWMIP